MKTLFFVLLLTQSSVASAAVEKTSQNSKKVIVYHVEALSMKDTTYSAHFQKDYESTITTANALTKDRLKRCGYELETKTLYYDASDPLQAKENAEKAAKGNAWLIVAPARSNHYLLSAKGAPETPSVSPLASSEEVASLGKLHLSLSPTNGQMAALAAKESARRLASRKSERTYASIVSEDCISCLDFAKHFDKVARRHGLRKIAEFKVTGEFPELGTMAKELAEANPSFILLPNYSKTSGYIMASLDKLDRNLFYVGGDGWGDSRFGYVQNGTGIDKAMGFTVRGFPPPDIGLKKFSLGKQALAAAESNPEVITPASGSSMAQLRMAESTMNLLCKYKPATKAEFQKVFSRVGPKIYSSPWGISIYNLKGGIITYKISEDI